MKIVLTIAGLDPRFGGPSRSVPSLANALVDQKLEVEIISPQERMAHRPPVEIQCGLTCVPCHHRYFPSGWLWSFGRAVRQALRSSDRRAVVHDNGVWLPTNQVAARAAQSCKAPRVVSTRGMLTPWSRRAGAWKKRTAWFLYQKRNLHTATLLHATSEAEANELRTIGLRQPITIIPNGVELAPSRPTSPSSQQTRQALFLSRIHPKKGLLNLVAAWAVVRPKDWSLLIAGPNEAGHADEVRKSIAAYGLQGSIRILGPAGDAEKWSLFHRSELFILPSFSENFGIAVAEALGAGLPVITTTATPWRSLEEVAAGWWIEPGVETMARALRDATQRSELTLGEMGARGRAMVERNFSWSSVGQKFTSVYHWLLCGGEKPDSIV